MNKMWLLTRVLLKNGESSFTFSKKRNTHPFVLYAILVVAFFPIAMLFGTMVSNLYTSLEPFQQTGLILALGFMTISLTIFFFGIFYVMNIFYFANDIETLLPLPLTPSQILGAKFATVVLYEYLVTAILFVPIVFTYGMKSGEGMLFYVYAILVFIAIPIIPLVLASILVMVMMRYTNVAKNKDRMKIIGGVVVILFAVGANFFLQSYTRQSMSVELVQRLMFEENALVQFVVHYFPTSVFPTEALINANNLNGLINIVLFIIISLIVLIVFLGLGEKMYFKGVYGVSETSAKRKQYSSNELSSLTKEKSPLFSLVLNEIKYLFRTPSYFLNCILSSLFVPFILVLAFVLNPDTTIITTILAQILEGNFNAGLVFSIVLIISIVFSSTNSVAATAVSREGKNFFVNKFLPIPYITQLGAKLLSGVFVSILSLLAMVVIAIFILKLSFDFILLSSVVMLLGSFLASIVGLLFDCFSPKLDWVNEQKAIKGNMNTVISLFINLLIGGGVTFVFAQFETSLWAGFLGVVLVLILLNIVGVLLLRNVGVKWYSSIEE